MPGDKTVIGAVVGWRGGKSPLYQALVPVALVLYTTPTSVRGEEAARTRKSLCEDVLAGANTLADR
jgi:hypothetical protein